MGFLLPRDVFLHRSAIVDYKYFVINALGLALIISPILLGAPAVADLTRSVLAPLAGAEGLGLIPGAGDHLGYTLVMIIAMDSAVFFAHYLQHKVPALWEFHKVHHSAEVLTPLTLYRTHPVEIFCAGMRHGLVMGLVTGVFFYAFRGQISGFDILGVDAAGFLFNFLGANLRHSHVPISYGPFEAIFISPKQHQIHHSRAREHFDKNFGSCFAFWDRLFGTFYSSESAAKTLEFGLSARERNHTNRLLSVIFGPFFALVPNRWRP